MEDTLIQSATTLLEQCRQNGILLATAESCTGGLIAGTLTEIAGSSDVFERGFVTYSNAAKTESLGVDAELIERFGAVSEDVARAMAAGAIAHSKADIAIAVTGVAGPGGGTVEKPVGLVHIAAAQRDGDITHIRCDFGDVGRSAVRSLTVARALDLLSSLVQS